MKPANLQFSPLLKISAERDLSPDQYKTVVKESFFCSQECLRASWSSLRLIQRKFSTHHLKDGVNGNANGSANGVTKANGVEHSGDAAIEAVHSATTSARSDGIFATQLENPRDFSEVGFVRSFAPTQNDIGHVLQLVCRYVHRLGDGTIDIGPPLSVESEPVRRLPQPPAERLMMNLATGERFHAKDRRPGAFRVLTYNVLSDIYTNSQAYPYCPKWGLAWTYRRLNLIREISQYDADVLCLQECQQDHYDEHFFPYFSRMGYGGVFKAKTRAPMGRRGQIDGCATFFRKSMFGMRESHNVEYNAVARGRTQMDRTLSRCLKGNVGLVLVLDAADGSGPLVVANTHLFWDPELTDVKLFQVDAFLQELEIISQRVGADTPIIIAGDFNSEPVSSVYELLSTGACTGRDDMGDDSYGVLATCRLQHSLRLRSSYSLSGHEPAYTNYTGSFNGTLDYVWYTPETIVATAVMEVPNKRTLFSTAVGSEGVEGLPNTQWSSDHLALCTDFTRAGPRHGGHGHM